MKVQGLEIKAPKDSAFRFPTPTHLPKLHQNCIFVGARGSGKGVAMANLIRMLPFDRVLVISPTFDSNKEILKDLKINREDVFDPEDSEVVKKVREMIEQEVADLESYRAELKLYKRFQRMITDTRAFQK